MASIVRLPKRTDTLLLGYGPDWGTLCIDNTAPTAPLLKFNANGTVLTLATTSESQPIFYPNGTAAAPSVSFTNSTDMGLFRVSASYLGFATGGVSRAEIGLGGFYLQSTAQIGWSTTTDPNATPDLIIRRSAAKTMTIDADGANAVLTLVQLQGPLNIGTGGSNYAHGEIGFNNTTSGANCGIRTNGTGTPILYFDHLGTSNTGSFVWRNGTAAATTLMTLAGTGALTLTSTLNVGAANPILWGAFSRIASSVDGVYSVTNQANTAGVLLDVATDSTLKVQTRGGALGTVLASSYSLAATTAQPANQTGNATSTLKMNGLGAAAAPATITPTSTGRVIFTITGDCTNSTILDGIQYKLVYGTGAAPANAAAATGTVISALRSVAVAVAAQNQGFSVTGLATGLAIGTAVWYDLQIANVTGGTASMSSITVVANEI